MGTIKKKDKQQARVPFLVIKILHFFLYWPVDRMIFGFFPVSVKDLKSGLQKIEGPLWKVPRC